MSQLDQVSLNEPFSIRSVDISRRFRAVHPEQKNASCMKDTVTKSGKDCLFIAHQITGMLTISKAYPMLSKHYFFIGYKS